VRFVDLRTAGEDARPFGLAPGSIRATGDGASYEGKAVPMV